MKFVDQIVFDDGKGDCLAACVASILDISRETVPNFAEMDFFEGMDRWLNKNGFKSIHVRFSDGRVLQETWFGYQEEPIITYGLSPRFDANKRRKGHAVVGQTIGYGVKMIHDPHPSRAGLFENPYGLVWIVKK